MIGAWKNWVDATSFAIEAQQVVTLRLMRLASGGVAGAAEAQRMVTEKAAAGLAAQAAATSALMAGRSFTAAARRAAVPYRRRVRANRRRLSGCSQ
jgi:hypothetical protein